MLKTEFAKILWKRSKAGKPINEAWSYIGRFIWGFTLVEYQVNQLFDALINVDYAASILLTYTLDLRKKLDLIELILKSRDVDASATFGRIHSLHDLRNVIAHWPFFDEGNGLSCDYVDKLSRTEFKKPGTKETDKAITFSEFDSYDANASELYEKLDELLESATPITDVEQAAIEEAISSSDNVVRFPNKTRESDKV
jgi:hypothetical protein